MRGADALQAAGEGWGGGVRQPKGSPASGIANLRGKGPWGWNAGVLAYGPILGGETDTEKPKGPKAGGSVPQGGSSSGAQNGRLPCVQASVSPLLDSLLPPALLQLGMMGQFCSTCREK